MLGHAFIVGLDHGLALLYLDLDIGPVPVGSSEQKGAVGARQAGDSSVQVDDLAVEKFALLVRRATMRKAGEIAKALEARIDCGLDITVHRRRRVFGFFQSARYLCDGAVF
jgi:hypothetical protein